MTGTEWTEPGKGATFWQLEHAYSVQTDYSGDRWREFLAIVNKNLPHHKLWGGGFYTERIVNQPTNLRLTGLPLTAEDLERIATCK